MNTFKAVALGLGVATVAVATGVVLYNRNRDCTEVYGETLTMSQDNVSRRLIFNTVTPRQYWGKDTRNYIAVLERRGSSYELTINDRDAQPCVLSNDILQQILREFKLDKYCQYKDYVDNHYTIIEK